MRPLSRNSATMRLAISLGTPKPIPTEPPVGETIAVFTAMTPPSRLKVGPPELPGLIGASIWMKSSNLARAALCQG